MVKQSYDSNDDKGKEMYNGHCGNWKSNLLPIMTLMLQDVALHPVKCK
jgi:hypothetical protein